MTDTLAACGHDVPDRLNLHWSDDLADEVCPNCCAKCAPRMPPCPVCQAPSRVIFRTDTDHPIPRCWDHAPTQGDALALGWLDPPTDPDRRDIRPAGRR